MSILCQLAVFQRLDQSPNGGIGPDEIVQARSTDKFLLESDYSLNLPIELVSHKISLPLAEYHRDTDPNPPVVPG